MLLDEQSPRLRNDELLIVNIDLLLLEHFLYEVEICQLEYIIMLVLV